MNKTILIDGTNIGEVRVALVEGGRLAELNYDTKEKIQIRGNIYVGYIARIEASLQAAFVDYGGDRHGFMPLDEISEEYHCSNVAEVNCDNFYYTKTRKNRTLIQDIVFVGQKLLVQVIKDERRNKGVTLTTYVALWGRLSVFMPNTPPPSDYASRKSIDAKAPPSVIDTVHNSPNSSLVLRANTSNAAKSDIQNEYERLSKIWSTIETKAENSMSPCLLYEEGSMVKRTINEHINDVQEIHIEGVEIYKDTIAHIESSFYSEEDREKISLYSSYIALFSYYGIEPQIDELYSNVVRLASGGSLVIGVTEALIAIDVNSGKMTRETADMESTALKTNIEAVKEIARQLKLRNFAGIIVIDLISMSSHSNKQLVESELKKAMSSDRAKVNIGKISEFGLLELSRQRIGVGFHELNSISCPSCHGIGTVQSTRSSAEMFIKSITRLLVQNKYSRITATLSKELMIYVITHYSKCISNMQRIHSTNVSFDISEDVGRQGFTFISGGIIIEPNNDITERDIVCILMEEYLAIKGSSFL